MAFTETFGGTTIYPSDVSYRAISLSANQTLAWPLEVATSSNVVAQIMDVTPSAGGFTITMPPANEASPGETALFFNAGSFNFTVADNAGNTIVAITPGLAYQIYLRTNTTVAGTWRTTQFGAGTSSATAGSLVGAGIKAINTTLNQSMAVTSLSVNYTAGAADRSAAFLWTGGAGTITLPAASTVGNDWFFHIRNGGTGAISLATTGGELINGTATVDFNPGDSAIIVCDGTGYFTIGFGQAPEFLFDYVSIDLTSQSSPYTLAGSNLNRIAYQFSGTLTTNMQIIVPATIQQYWVGNFTTGGSYTLTVKTSAGTGVVVPRDARAILYCNGTNVVTADTGGISIPILVSQGGTGATNASSARTNLGATSIGNALFIAVDEATARNAIIAAKSGANSDITSLTGLTTPLSVPQGGTGVATFTANGIVYGSGASALAVTVAGTTGQVLVGNTGTAPSWSTLSGIGVTSFSAGSTGLTPSTATTGIVTLAGTLIVANGGTGATTLTGYVKGSGTSALTASATIPATDISGGAALTKTDDTNVTLTLGGTPASALLAATSLTLGWSGQLSVARGGTGQSSYTDGQLLIGNSTGNTLTKATLTAGTNVTITNGSGSITINATDQYVGTVTSVSGTGTVSGLTLTGTVTTSGSLTLGGTLAVTASDFASQTAKTFLAAPNASAGVPSFRAIIPADVPTLNQNTTGTASNVTGTVAVANGGTGTTTAFTAGSVVFAGASGVYSQDNANLFWDDTNNRLGIGTASPSTKLDVVNSGVSQIQIQNTSGTTKNTQLMFADNVGSKWRIGMDVATNNNTNNFQLYNDAASAAALTVDSSGNVGIGTSSPGTKLTVAGASEAIRMANATPYLSFYNAAQSTRFGYIQHNGTNLALVNGEAGSLEMYTSNTLRATLNSSGNLLVGTTTDYGGRLTLVPAANPTTASASTNQIAIGEATNNTAYKLNVGYIFTGGTYAGSVQAIGGGAGIPLLLNADGGNVGIGTSTPDIFSRSYTRTVGINSSGTTMLQINGTTYGGIDLGFNGTRTANIIAETGGFYLQAIGAAPMVFVTNGAERMRIADSGRVGVGTTNPQLQFVVSNSGAGGLEFDPTGVIQSYNRSTSAYATVTLDGSINVFRISGTEKARIDSSGNLLVGTTSSTGGIAGTAPRLVVEPPNTSTHGVILKSLGQSYDVGLIWNTAASGDNRFFEFGTDATYTARGSISYNRAGGLVAYNVTSDYRAKDIIGPVTDAGATIDALKVYSGKMKGATIARPMLVAHEAQEVVPYAVTGEKDAVNEDGTDKYQQMDHQSFIPLLIAEIQSLRARVAQLEGN